uniref:Uncharacterized protein n=1 Tax=candidate division CPR3 bacterium TaxID=2268181 RepID=A0A7C4M276_UNCC3
MKRCIEQKTARAVIQAFLLGTPGLEIIVRPLSDAIEEEDALQEKILSTLLDQFREKLEEDRGKFISEATSRGLSVREVACIATGLEWEEYLLTFTGSRKIH